MNTCPNCGLVLNHRGECPACDEENWTASEAENAPVETDEDRALCAADDARKREIEDPNK